MHRLLTKLTATAAVLALAPCAATATVITFEGLQANTPVPAGYAGLTWGTSSVDAFAGETGYFQARDDASYATPASPVNYVTNVWGPDRLWFAFSGPTFFNGAWFAAAIGALPGNQATQVRFADELGNTSPWLDLAADPQYLAADFVGATTIYVERRGGAGEPGFGNARWYTMDDVTYGIVPEVGNLAIVLTGGVPLAGLAIRRRLL